MLTFAFFLLPAVGQAPELVVQSGHTWRIDSMVVSPDGKLVASASGRQGDGTVKLWETATGRNIRTLSAGGANALAFSPDGKSLAAGDDFSISIWEVNSGRELRRFYVSTAAEVRYLAFSPDGRHLASWTFSPIYGSGHERSGDEDRCPNVNKPGFCEARDVTVWDVAEGKFLFNVLRPQIDKPDVRTQYSWHVAFSPDGKTLAVGVDHFEMQLWDVATHKQLPVLPSSAAPFVFDSTGRQIASRTLQGETVVWDTATRKQVSTMANAGNPAAFAERDSILRTITGENNAEIVHSWNVADGSERGTLELDQELGCANCYVHLSPDGRWAVRGGFGEPKVVLWDLTAPSQPPRLWLDLEAPLVFSPDGRFLAAVTAGYYNAETASNAIWTVDLKSGGESCASAGKLYRIGAVAVNGAAARLAVASGDDVNLWDLSSGTRGPWLRGGNESIYDLSFSDDGKWLVSGYTTSNMAVSWMPGIASPGQKVPQHDWHEPPCRRETARPPYDYYHPNGVWDLASMSAVSRLPAMAAPVAISHDGTKIASATAGAVVNIWNVADATGGQIKDERPGRLIASEDTMVRALAISADNKWLATAMEDDNFLKIWDLATYKYVTTLSVPKGQPPKTVGGRTQIFPSTDIVALAFDPVSRILASGSEDGSVHLWNVGEQHEIGTSFKVEGSGWLGVKFSNDGQKLVATAGNRVEVWDPKTGTRISVLQTQGRSVSDAAFSADGKYVFTGGADGTTCLWDASSGRFVASLVAIDNTDWAVVDADGRWDASERAQTMMHYIQATKDGYEVFNLAQLKDIYHTPGLLSRILGYSKQPLAAVRPLSDIKLFPEITERSFDKANATLTVKLRNRGGSIGPVRIMVNGSLAFEDARSDQLKQQLKANPNLAVATVRVSLRASSGYNPSGQNKIEVITNDFDPKTQRSFVSSDPTTSARGAEIVGTATPDEGRKPTLYAVVAGISDYNGTALDLNFAAKDAESFAAALSVAAGRLFCPAENPKCEDKVRIKLFSTNSGVGQLPTKENIRAAFAAIAKEAKPEDILVVYLAGHGTSLKVGDDDTYFFLTQESEAGSPDAVAKNPERAISNTELLSWLTQEQWRPDKKGIDAGNKVLILDTCAAGAFENALTKEKQRSLSPDQIRALEKLKDRSGLQILMGSAANQSAYEASQYGQGLLTYALLEGIKGAALTNDRVETGRLFDYAVNRVPTMDITRGAIGLQSPRIFGSTSIPIGIMATKEDRDAVKILESPLPVFTRPFLFKKDENYDTLGLITELGNALYAAADPGSRGYGSARLPAPLVYVNEENFPGAYRVTGTYTDNNGTITINAVLRKDGNIIATLPEITAGREKMVDELLAAIRTELSKLKT